MRWATAHRVPVVPRGAGSGLRGGATAVDGSVVLSHRADAHDQVDPVTRTAVVQPGLLNAEVKARGRRARAVVPAGSVVVRDVLDRRQRRHQRGRAVLREVRRDHRLRPRHAGGARRRHRGAPRRPAPEGRGRPVADQAVRRQRGHARRHHGDHAAPDSRATARRRTVVAIVRVTCSPPPTPFSAITRALRPSMLEFMDRTAIDAVEDAMKMGLDRDGSRDADRAVRRAGSDYAAAEAETMAQACRDAGAVEVFHTDDPEEGEAFCAARRFAIPAVERMGDLLLEDVGVPLPAASRAGERHRRHRRPARGDGVRDRARRRRQHPPADRLRPRPTPR